MSAQVSFAGEYFRTVLARVVMAGRLHVMLQGLRGGIFTVTFCTTEIPETALEVTNICDQSCKKVHPSTEIIKYTMLSLQKNTERENSCSSSNLTMIKLCIRSFPCPRSSDLCWVIPCQIIKYFLLFLHFI